jgi:hypothetical protein
MPLSLQSLSLVSYMIIQIISINSCYIIFSFMLKGILDLVWASAWTLLGLRPFFYILLGIFSYVFMLNKINIIINMSYKLHILNKNSNHINV